MKKQKTTSHSEQKEVPMLFSTPMIEALLAGTKTETRRDKNLKEINENPDEWSLIGKKDSLVPFLMGGLYRFGNKDGTSKMIKCPWAVGNILWCRETWRPDIHFTDLSTSRNDIVKVIRYKAGLESVTVPTEEEEWFDNLTKDGKLTYKSSMFMRRKFARIFLEVKEVTIERLHDITGIDAIHEGILSKSFEFESPVYFDYTKGIKTYISCFSPIDSYKSLWKSINGSESWDLNPFVWRIQFKRIENYK